MNQPIIADGARRTPDVRGRAQTTEPRLAAGQAGVLEIRYTANSFVAPEKLRFRHRLEGAAWREAGTRRAAFYTNLRPGSYRFQVEASNQDGTWSIRPAEFAFSLTPKFAQTIWFPASCAAGLLAVSGAFTAWRLRWQRRAFQAERAAAVEQERTRIARDLHDDLGASLTGIALEMEAVQRRGRAEANQLATLVSDTRALANGLRELAWTTNPRCDNAGSLGAFLGELVERFCQAAGLECKLELPAADDLRAVPARAA